MSEEYMDIKVYNGDDETKYIKYDDMINLIAKIKIKQDEKDKEIERLNNIIKEVREYIKENCIDDEFERDKFRRKLKYSKRIKEVCYVSSKDYS